MSINTTLNYSPNFDKKKRKFKQIKFEQLEQVSRTSGETIEATHW